MWDACLCKARTHSTYEHDQKRQKIEAHTYNTHKNLVHKLVCTCYAQEEYSEDGSEEEDEDEEDIKKDAWWVCMALL